jgi:hypothetical protein
MSEVAYEDLPSLRSREGPDSYREGVSMYETKEILVRKDAY